MSVSGDRIDVVLRVNGVEVEQFQAHPSVLDGPFTLGDVTYLVQGQEVIKRDVLTVVSKVIQVEQQGDDYPVLAYGSEMVPTWLVMLDLLPADGQGVVGDG